MNLLQQINNSLLEEQSRRGAGSGKFTPSFLGRCYRAQIWKRRGEKPTNPPDVRTLRVFKVGKLFHEFVQSYLPPHQVEVKVETEDIIGFADIVTNEEVMDIKTVHSRAFWHMAKSNYDITKEKFTNILQVMTYAYLLKKPKGRLIFISKDDLCVEEYGFHIDVWGEKVEKELKTLRSWWDSGGLPPAEPRAYGGKECSYCNFRDLCEKTEAKKEEK